MMQGRAGREPKNAAVGKVEAWEARLFRGGVEGDSSGVEV